MTELEAVNYLLGVLGSSPVGELTNKNPDVDIAQTALANAITHVTSVGFWFNQVYNITLSPDPVTKKIDITGYFQVISRSPQYAVNRGDALFDPINNVYTFENDVIIDGVARLDFDKLPEIVQHACKFFAAAQLCANDLEDSQKQTDQATLYNNAYIQVKNEDLRIKRRNAQSTPRVARALSRVFPARGTRRYGPNFGGR